jgi:Arc/MetJ-type ribon-helix-helix transcriptional regulator
LEPHEVGVLDAEVASGQAKNRSDAVRQSIAYLDRYRSYRQDADIMARLLAVGEPLYPDLESIPPADLAD